MKFSYQLVNFGSQFQARLSKHFPFIFTRIKGYLSEKSLPLAKFKGRKNFLITSTYAAAQNISYAQGIKTGNELSRLCPPGAGCCELTKLETIIKRVKKVF